MPRLAPVMNATFLAIAFPLRSRSSLLGDDERDQTQRGRDRPTDVTSGDVPLMAATVRIQHDGPVASLILDRPARYNAMSAAMRHDLAGALAELAASDARAVVVRGEGDAFSAGADLHSLSDDVDLDDPAAIRDYVLGWSHNVIALRDLPVPTIAAVRGAAYGGGFSLAIACDIVIASRTARFNTQYVNIGIN